MEEWAQMGLLKLDSREVSTGSRMSAFRQLTYRSNSARWLHPGRGGLRLKQETSTPRCHLPRRLPEELAGKPARFEVTIKEHYVESPELDDDFAQDADYESLAAMRDTSAELPRRQRAASAGD